MADLNEVQDNLPTWDEAAQQIETDTQSKLPTWDEAAEHEDPSVQKAFGNLVKASAADIFHPIDHSELTEAQRIWQQKQPAYNTIQAFGQGYADTFKQETFDAITEASLKEAQMYKAIDEHEATVNGAFMDGTVIPIAKKLWATTSTSAVSYGKVLESAFMSAPYAGYEAAAGQIGEEVHNTQVGSFLQEAPDAFIYPEALFPAKPLPKAVATAKANRILESEAEFMGTREPTPPQAQKMQEAAAMYPEETAPATPRTVHEEARAIAPEVFEKYDSMVREKDIYRGMLDTLGAARDQEAAALAPHNAEIADLQSKIEGASARNAKRYEGEIADLRAKNDEWVEHHKRTDTDEMAKIRKTLLETDYAMRDLAHTGEMAKAYREAERRLPSEPAIEPLAELKEETADVPAEGQSTPGSPESSTPASISVKPIELQRETIVKDVQDSLIKAGRSVEEADAASQLIAAHYEARSQRFEGKRGTAEEMYMKDSPTIRAGRERKVKELSQKGKELEQKAKGKIRLATDDAKATITLFKTADASTFIHETGHHWLDELVKDASHEAAPELLKKDTEAVRKWLGNQGEELTTRQHEKFARGFERYMMEGVAPSKGLARVFAQFKQWLTSLYQTVDRLKAPITDDIRDVFDRLLSNAPERAVVSPEALEAGTKTEIAAPVAEGTETVKPSTHVVVENVPEEQPAIKAEQPESPNTQLGAPASELIDKAGNIRVDNLNTPEDVNVVIRQAAEQNNGFLGARRGVITDAQVSDLADALGMTASTLDVRKLGEAYNAEQVVAARKLLIQSATNVRDLMNQAATGGEEAVMAYAEAKARHLMIQEQVSGITAEAGRALRAFRKLEGAEQAQALGDFLKDATGKDLFQLQEEARRGALLETPAQVSKYIQDSQKAKFSDMMLEYWINSLLSGPMTHVKNTLGNAFVALTSVAETAVASGVGKILGSEDRVYAAEAQARLFGVTQGAKDGLRAAKAIIKDEDAISGAHTVEQSRVRAIPGALGEVVRIPSRLLSAEDEIFKAIAYRQEINAVAVRTASKEGLVGDAFNQRLADLTTNPTQEMMDAAVKNAEYQTFTQKLGSFGAGLQKLANSNIFGLPIPKFIVPFVRTPTNILKYAAERTPLGLFSKEIRDNLAGVNGTVARDTQIARMAIGSALGIATLSMAAEGTITGGGPIDPKQKAMLRMTGWQPYSVKINGTYYSYAWAEPLATIMGVSADIVDAAKADAMTDEEHQNLSVLLFKSISKDVMSKLSLRGMSDLMNAVTNPDQYGESYLQNIAGTAVPAFMAQTARTIDPTMRQTRSAMDAIRARVPGLRDDLLPVRDVWGDPIVRQGNLGPDILSPIYETKVNQDPVNQALIDAKVFPSRLDRKIRGVELTDEQYDDYSRLAGRLAKMRLNNVVAQPGFNSIPDYTRAKIIDRMINASREQARKAVMMKYPNIMQQAFANKRREITGAKKP